MMALRFGREDVTRTRDPYVPNVVRYQLRYFSSYSPFGKKACKITAFFSYMQIFLHFFAFFFHVKSQIAVKIYGKAPISTPFAKRHVSVV